MSFQTCLKEKKSKKVLVTKRVEATALKAAVCVRACVCVYLRDCQIDIPFPLEFTQLPTGRFLTQG